MPTADSAPWRNLGYATFSMALGFAAWGLISAFAPTFRAQFNLSAQSAAFLVAVPVLLGSLARLPIGLLTDRYGGRIVFTVLFLFVSPLVVVTLIIRVVRHIKRKPVPIDARA